MTDDDKALVERLRNSDFYDDNAAYWLPDAGKADALCEQAADRIEALSAEVEKFSGLARLAILKAYDTDKALSAENERLRDALAKSEALQDLAYYNGAKQYASICAQSEDAARDWLNGGCGNRQRDAIAALGDTK